MHYNNFPKICISQVIGVKSKLHSYSSGKDIHSHQELSLQAESGGFWVLLKTRIYRPGVFSELKVLKKGKHSQPTICLGFCRGSAA